MIPCPECGAETIQDTVDVGPCEVPTGPRHCLICGWSERPPEFFETRGESPTESIRRASEALDLYEAGAAAVERFDDSIGAIDAFHAHLDDCFQCRSMPFNLCPIGARMIHQAVQSIEVPGVPPLEKRGGPFDDGGLEKRYAATIESDHVTGTGNRTPPPAFPPRSDW